MVTTMVQKYEYELMPILHRILDVSSNTNIHLNQVPNWPRDSLPKSPIVQKLGLIIIPILYPWWCRDLEIEYEQFGPYSPIIASVFEEMLTQGQCSIQEEFLDVQPATFEEKSAFPEITELIIHKLLSYSNNPILTQFECIELFSIISVEQEQLFRSMKILRRMTVISDDLKKNLIKRVFRRMREIPHLNSFINERGSLYASKFISETIDAFYESVTNLSFEKLFEN